MKIGFISAHPFTYPGGVQKHTLALKERLEDEGHIVKLIFPREEIPQQKEKDMILLGGAFYFSGNASKANLSLQITPLKTKRMLKKEKFDILHFQNFGVFLPIQVLESANNIKKNPPLKILTLHALWDASRIFQEFSFILNIFNNYFLPKFDGVIAVSSPVVDQIRYKGPIEIIPNGVDADFFNPQGKRIRKFDDGKINILFVGRIEERKGLFYLLKAFSILKKKNRNIRLIVVGEGNEKEEMESFVKNHRIKDVVFEGKVREEDLPKYYRTSDIFCSPALFGESFGIVLLEAMASSRPVVAFANRGYKEVLKGKAANFLVKPKDIKTLSKKLEQLIENEKLREEMGKWGRKEVEKYSWDKIAKDTLNFYNKVLKSKNISKR
jgi:phosphatidylinositol alpha-mannosyltransferase